MSGSPLDPLVQLMTHLAITIGAMALATLSIVAFTRWLGLHWSWTLPCVLLGPALWSFDQEGAGVIAATALLATATGARWHQDDLRHGGDRAQDARDRRTPLDATRERMERRSARGGRWVDRRGLAVGRDERGRTVRIPVGHRSGRHALVVDATGSGKTVTQAWIAGRLVREGYGAVVIDPKGDRLLHDELEHAARKARRTFRVWSPEGPAVYNPFAHGTDTELADKVLAGETYTEPHYLRQAQRYLGHAVRALRGNGWPITVMTLSEAMVPERLEYLGRARPGPADDRRRTAHQPVPTLVLVDEFSAVAAGGVVRLFGRGRSAGLSLLVGTQELADLRPPDNPTLADQVLGNIATLIAHRQVVPASAETVAGVIGTRGAWTTTERTETFLGASAPSGAGTRTRTREFVIHPDTIKHLPTGTAAVTSPGHAEPAIARMNHPE